MIYVTPLLNTTAARTSMQPAIDFVTARNGSAVVEELPSWLTFFEKYVPSVEAVRFYFPPSVLMYLIVSVYPPKQPVGLETAMGSRLLPSRLFSTASGRAQLSALITETLAFTSPYVIVGTPWLYKPVPGTAGTTAVTPAWRDAVWHLTLESRFQFNDTLVDLADGYRALSQQTQKFRDLAPESGSYFVSSAALSCWLFGGGS